MNVLLTGAAGFIGGHAAAKLRADGHEVFAASRSGEDGVRLDLSAPLDESALPPRVDAVVHLAQSQRFRDFPAEAVDVFEVNAASTVRLLDWSRRAGATTFVLASTGGIYGTGDEPFTEDAPPSLGGDLGFYVTTKACAELIARSYAGLMKIVILRFFFVYGPGQRETMLVPRLIRTIASGAAVTLQGEDGMRLNPTYIDDAVEAIARSLSLPQSETINVAGPQVLSLRDVATTIAGHVGVQPNFTVDQTQRPRHLIGSTARMAQRLNVPRTRFAQGVAAMLGAGA